MRRFLYVLSFVAVAGFSCVSEPVNHRPAARQNRPRPSPQEIPLPAPYQGQSHRDTRHAPGDPSWFPRFARISPRWTTIVIHHSATARGNASVFDKGHRDKGWDELGYHFVIGNGTGSGDGVVEVGSRWNRQKHGAHCKTPDNYFNEHGIGICLVGDFTKSRPTPRQMASLERLVAFLADRCGIPPERVTTHQAVTHKTRCPGNFPIAMVRRSLASGATASSLP